MRKTWDRTGLTRPILVALAAALVGAILARRFAIPGGAFTGAMLLPALLSVLGVGLAEPPRWLNTVSRVVLGVTTGAAVTNETIQAVGRALLPVSAMVVCMMGLSIAAAWALSHWARMNRATALCGAAPGQLGAMVTLADDLGGDAPTVASLHLVRLLSVLVILPLLVTTLFPYRDAASVTVAAVAAAPATRFARLALLLAAGLLAGVLANRYRIPAGEFLAAMIVSAALNPTLLRLADLPSTWKLSAQWIVGGAVGASVTRETLRHFKPYMVAGGLMTLFLIVTGLLLGWALSVLSGIDLVTCLMGTAPGGATNLIILAEELGADAQLVSAMHVSRIVIIMLLLPLLVRLAAGKRRTAAAVATPADSSQ